MSGLFATRAPVAVLPLLEKSGLETPDDFLLAFSPEREDPGRKDFNTRTTPKLVGGVNQESTEIAAELYRLDPFYLSWKAAAETFAKYDALVLCTAHDLSCNAELYRSTKLVVDTRDLLTPLFPEGDASHRQGLRKHSIDEPLGLPHRQPYPPALALPDAENRPSSAPRLGLTWIRLPLPWSGSFLPSSVTTPASQMASRDQMPIQTVAMASARMIQLDRVRRANTRGSSSTSFRCARSQRSLTQ